MHAGSFSAIPQAQWCPESWGRLCKPPSPSGLQTASTQRALDSGPAYYLGLTPGRSASRLGPSNSLLITALHSKVRLIPPSAAGHGPAPGLETGVLDSGAELPAASDLTLQVLLPCSSGATVPSYLLLHEANPLALRTYAHGEPPTLGMVQMLLCSLGSLQLLLLQHMSTFQ